MIKREEINGSIFIAQTTFYVYRSEEDLNGEKPAFITSSETEFNYLKNSLIEGVVDLKDNKDVDEENLVLIKDLDISVRCYQQLKSMNIVYLNDLKNYTQSSLINDHGLTNKSISEILYQLKLHNI